MTDEGFRRIDPEQVDFSAGRMARKTAWVAARPAREGERIATILRDSHVETTNIAKATDMVVSNPAGERYIVEGQKFMARYQKTDTAGLYQPRNAPVRVVSLSENVEFVAPWGEIMRIRAGGVLVLGGPGDIYGIQPEEFAETYEYVD